MERSYTASDLRERNFRVVFEMARLKGNLLRSDISNLTGMTPPTVMKIVQHFTNKNILRTAGEVDTLKGRRPTLLTFNPNAAYAIGVLMEDVEMHAGLVNLSGEIIKYIKVPMDIIYSNDTLLMFIELVNRLKTGVDAPILGIGVGVPGVVDVKKRIIEFAPLVGISKAVDCSIICENISDNTDLTVFMDNNVNAEAVGEFSYRRLRNDDLLYITVGIGIGAGLILNGQLRRGGRYLAGELGYAVSNSSSKVDPSQPGCLESLIGQEALKKRFNWKGYGEGNETPQGLVEYLVDNLAPAVANLATQLDIKLLIAGGIAVDTLGDRLLKPLHDKINQLSLSPVNLCTSACVDSGVAGAAMIAMDDKIDQWLCRK
jgi:predicted NBD/HSP70 family sugar kinase